MYIDSKKFDYKKFSYPNADRMIERDKKAAQDAYHQWLRNSVEDIVERQWEIDDVGAIEQVGEFVKLLKEAEFTYAIGAFTSSIALIGICAEDLCRFFSINAGHNLDSLNQIDRVNRLRSLGAISPRIADKFHAIRKLRNDCLHYNQGFKQKDISLLKVDALNALNSIKTIYAEILGVIDYQTVDASKLSEIVNTIANEAANSEIGNLGVGEAVSRTRNLFASAFGIDLSMNNSGSPVYKTSIFKVVEIDIEDDPLELTLCEVVSGLYVIVDVTTDELKQFCNTDIGVGDIIIASIVSVPNNLELTGTWRLWSDVKKLG